MDWIKLLTEFEGHPKVLAAGNAGAGVYARALAYCGKYETDGRVPKEWADQAIAREGQQDVLDRLVASGLWNECDGGYEIRDFTEVNRSHEEMQNLRETRSTAGKKGGKAKPQAKRKQTASKSPSSSNSTSESSSQRKTIRPDPNELPPDADERLATTAKACLPILQRTAEARGAKPVALLAVYRAVEQFPRKDHLRVAGEVEHWLLHGNGARATAKDIVSRFRNFLDGSPDRVRPVPSAEAGPSPYEASVREVRV